MAELSTVYIIAKTHFWVDKFAKMRIMLLKTDQIQKQYENKKQKKGTKMKTSFSYIAVETDDQRVLAIDELIGL
jgi:hypothetical protein